MPRGRPKGGAKKKAPVAKRAPIKHKSINNNPPEEEAGEVIEVQEPQVVEVKHKTEWSEFRPVDDPPPEETIFEEEEETKRRYNNNAEALRKKLGKAGVLPGSQLKLTIEKYHHSDAIDGAGGSWTEKEHCTKYVCGEEHIINEDYLDVARRYGPGLYRFTIRRKNTIITSWDKRISGAPAAILEAVNPADPTSPHVVVTDNKPVAVIDPIDNMVKTVQAFQKMKKALEIDAAAAAKEQGAPPQVSPVTDPKIAALQLIAENPEIMERIGSGLAKTVLGSKHIDSDPWADVAMEAIKTGQAAALVKTAIDSIFAGVNGLFPKGNQNGQAPMGAPQMAQSPNQNNGGAQAGASQTHPTPQNEAGLYHQIPEGMVSASQTMDGQAAMTTEDQALALVIEHCRRRLPVKVCFNRLINFADAIEEQAPAGSIYDYIELFGKMPIDAAIEFVNGLPGGREVTALPHCKDWTTELQKMIRDSQEIDEKIENGAPE